MHFQIKKLLIQIFILKQKCFFKTTHKNKLINIRILHS